MFHILGAMLLAAAPAPSAPAGAPQLETPASVQVGPEVIAVRMRSNGCTRKEDFRVTVNRHEGASRLNFFRLRPDRCRAYLRDGIVLQWTRQELGLSPASALLVSASDIF